MEIKNFFKNRKVQISLVIVFCFLIIGTLAIFSFKTFKKPLSSSNYFLSLKKKIKIIQPEEKKMVPGKLDGLLVDEEKKDIIPIAIVIENLTDSRPQAGLDQAKIVYETLAEGGITRFLAIFDNTQEIEKIGPVRSARPYFFEWTKEVKAIFAHCGGSPQALDMISKSNILDLNQINSGQKYFWRETKRVAPHNLYTSIALLKNAIGDKKAEVPFFEEWKFKKNASTTSATPTQVISSTSTNIASTTESIVPQKVTINFSTLNYKVDYVYDLEKKAYKRFVANQPALMENKKEIFVKNLIIQYFPKSYYDELRIRLETIGEGKGFVCLDGKCQEIKWSKISQESRTRFFYLSGEEVEFNPGNTWIEAISSDIQISIE